jgi:hypothetical protein
MVEQEELTDKTEHLLVYQIIASFTKETTKQQRSKYD